MKRIILIPVILHRAFLSAVDHDCFNLAQSSGRPTLAIAFIAVATGFGGSALPETALPVAREPCAAAARRP